MIRLLLAGVLLLAVVFGMGIDAKAAITDIIATSEGDLKITLIGHSSLHLETSASMWPGTPKTLRR